MSCSSAPSDIHRRCAKRCKRSSTAAATNTATRSGFSTKKAATSPSASRVNPRSLFEPRLEAGYDRSEEHTSELQSLRHLVCRLLLEKKNKTTYHVIQRGIT